MMSDNKKYSYDEVPYPNNPFPQSHPDRLATIAMLFGMSPQPVHACRVLELGCGRGGNLVPLAEQLPGSEFVGVELSLRQISEAREWVKRLGFQNVELKHMNLLEVDAGLGKFDYIICHGVFSWVPRIVQDRILDICAENLASQGVAYVSYNTYPGWNMRGMIRDMMCYHSQHFDEPQVRIDQARGLLDFLAQNTPDKDPYGMFLKSELASLRNQDDGYLYHEHLEDVNDPIYFYQFAERAESRGLAYLGETDMSAMYSGHLPTSVRTTLQSVASNLIQMEQYTDFIRNRMFRQTLLRHREVEIDRELRPSDLESLYVASALVPENANVGLHAAEPLTLKDTATGRKVTAASPMLKAALLALAEAWPANIAYPQLRDRSRTAVDRRTFVSAQQLNVNNNEFGTDLLRFYINNLIELHSQPSCFVTQPGTHPAGSLVARSQLDQGNLVTTLRHGRQVLDDFPAHVLRYLDGTRDRNELVDALLKLVDDGVLVVQRAADAITRDQLRMQLAAALDQTLRYLGCAALLPFQPTTIDTEPHEPTPAAAATVATREVSSDTEWTGVWN